MVRVESMTYFQDHKWYDELANEKLKEETLMHKAKVEESWGNATPGVMKFSAWLKSSFENFHELDYNVLVKLQECWWKVNAHEVVPFTRSENYSQGPYANAKTKRTYNPYLDINRIFGSKYGADNAGYAQDNQEHKMEQHDPSTCRVRRFENIKYSFDAEDEYVSIKKHQFSDHSETNINTCQAYRELFRIMDEGWLDAIRGPCCKKIDDMVYSEKDILTPLQHTFAKELKLENHPEQHINGVPHSNSIFHSI
ncbi:hypothetical protein Tco_1502196 [Tanacetum coccineum]